MHNASAFRYAIQCADQRSGAAEHHVCIDARDHVYSLMNWINDDSIRGGPDNGTAGSCKNERIGS